MPAFYSNSINGFLRDDDNSIIGTLTSASANAGYSQQRHTQTLSWRNFISLLKLVLSQLTSICDYDISGILLEFPIPRREKRIDCVLIISNLIIVIEYKDGEEDYNQADSVQLEDYCLDLRDFHLGSNGKTIVPILLASNAKSVNPLWTESNDYVQHILKANARNFHDVLTNAILKQKANNTKIDFREWNRSIYSPTPTIVEAAQALYAGKSVEAITRSHAEAENLSKTKNAVLDIVRSVRNKNAKAICFITGVPGAGKTLVGLDLIHNAELVEDDKEIGVFLSGNGPLVRVLREALARDSHRRADSKKSEATRKVKTFIQNVHEFVKEYYVIPDKYPVENIIVFDEAQRAWNAKKLNAWNARNATHEYKKDVSEAEMVIDIMDRQPEWAFIIALVGGGQEIHDGEAGLPEWGATLSQKFPHWKIFISSQLKEGDHSTGNLTLFSKAPAHLDITEIRDLHLQVSIRSYKAQELSQFVAFVLDNKPNEASRTFKEGFQSYPIFLTRSLIKMKEWLKEKQRGTHRIGLVATSGARRLRPFGLDVKADFEVEEWFLNPHDDVRSSYSLEVPATEFGIQGLELDWIGLCWDADMRRNGNKWDFRNFTGTEWKTARQEEKQRYILNKYRVLMTRARQGLIIWVPEGSKDDRTRDPDFYDPIYEYLKSCGIPEL